MNPDERSARIELACKNKVGPKSFLEILTNYGSAAEYLKKHPIADNQRKKTHMHGTNLCVYGDEPYPLGFKNMADPPPLFMYKGTLSILSSYDKLISIVGTRNNSSYGASVTKHIVTSLCAQGFVVVSGMAYGIDSIAHSAALQCGGKTVAIMGTHINHPYPAQNRRLYEQIVSTGLVISENIENTMSNGVFPRRNRLIAGIAPVTLVIEAGEKSGAVLTARQALNYNREVYAVPGSVFSRTSIGTNWLIQTNHAQLFTDVDSLLTQVQTQFITSGQKAKISIESKNLGENANKIFECLTVQPKTADEVSIELGVSYAATLQTLTTLETNGIISKQITGQYCLT